MKLESRRLYTGLGIVVIVLVALVAYFAFAPKTAANSVTVHRGDIAASVTATGKVRSKRAAKLSLPQAGTVTTISKVEGDDVKAGDVILALRGDEASRRVKQAELNLQNRQLDVARAKAAPRDEDIDIARANVQKATIAAAAADAAYTASATSQTDACPSLLKSGFQM